MKVTMLMAITSVVCSLSSLAVDKTNVILVMCDDLGWGDVGFNGGKVIKTPHLDKMAENSLVFDRFYAASAVCSPTRGSVVTGRNPYRYGIPTANKGHMKSEEITIYEVLKSKGYRTGHFGKWHLGTLSKTVKESNRGGPKGEKDYSPPWEHGVDVVFATEAKVPTYDPMDKPAAKVKGDFMGPSGKGWWPIGEKKRAAYGTHYWTGENEMVDPKTLTGDDSKIILDHAIPFIEESAKSKTPFLAVIWLHAPHLPVVAGKEHTSLYPDSKDGFHANYYGCVSAVDDQIGRIRKTLRDLGIAENTLLAFTSDNGPEGKKDSPGSAGDLTGRKRSLREGGIRVPGLIEWPALIKSARRTSFPAGTMDYFPTIIDLVGYKMPDTRPIDGVSLLTCIEKEIGKRAKPIGFMFAGQSAYVDNGYKIYRKKGNTDWMLYHLEKDPSEKLNLALKNPEVLGKMKMEFKIWRESVQKSAQGDDY